jgi:hypothetical protein
MEVKSASFVFKRGVVGILLSDSEDIDLIVGGWVVFGNEGELFVSLLVFEFGSNVVLSICKKFYEGGLM